MARNDPHSVNDPAQGRITHLDLDLTVDFDNEVLSGTATLRLEGASGALDLDTRDLDISAVVDAAGRELPFTLGSRDDVMGQPLRLELAGPTESVTIRYATAPAASALQWLEPAMTAGGEYPYMFSQCQAIHARSVIPVQDSPSVRFSYAARITVPDPLAVVMSAAPGEAAAGPAPGTRTFSFSMPQPIPSYLFAIAVGHLAYRDLGPRSRVYTEPEMLDASAWEFAGVDGMLQAAEKLFGPYRWERFDFLVMPPSFPYGGMENPRLTFLTPTLIAGDRTLVNVLAHELAHSWTGNLVTNATINDFWINEGFTVWAERRILEALEGPEVMALAAAIGRAGLQEDLDRFGHDSPHTRLRDELEGIDPDEVYSRVPYEKGFLFVCLLEQTVGREAWDRFIRAYIDEFGFTSLTTRQLEAFLEERLPGILEKVDAVAWIDGPGLPANAPAFTSPRLEELCALATNWGEGTRPNEATLRGFSAVDWMVFLEQLPRKLPLEECAWLDKTFELSASGNSEILMSWLVIAATSGYEPVYGRIREVLAAVGRMKYLKPLFRALHENDKSKGLAAEVFAAHGDSYHPIARGGIERILAS